MQLLFVYTWSCASHWGLELQQIPNVCCHLIFNIGGGLFPNALEAEYSTGDWNYLAMTNWNSFFGSGDCNVGMYKDGIRMCLVNHYCLLCRTVILRTQKKCFKLFLSSLRQKLLNTLHGYVLSLCARLRDGQRGFQKGKTLRWKPLICDMAWTWSLVLSWRLLFQNTTSGEPYSSAEIFISCHQWLSMSYCTQKTKGVEIIIPEFDSSEHVLCRGMELNPWDQCCLINGSLLLCHSLYCAVSTHSNRQVPCA